MSAKPTLGVWKINKHARRVVEVDDITVASCGNSTIVPEEEQLANALLVAEAGTVFHATGMSPQQLADNATAYKDSADRYLAQMSEAERRAAKAEGSRDKLLAALKGVVLVSYRKTAEFDQAVAAIACAEAGQ